MQTCSLTTTDITAADFTQGAGKFIPLHAFMKGVGEISAFGWRPPNFKMNFRIYIKDDTLSTRHIFEATDLRAGCRIVVDMMVCA